MGNIILFLILFSKVNPIILNFIYFLPEFNSNPFICLNTTFFITVGISISVSITESIELVVSIIKLVLSNLLLVVIIVVIGVIRVVGTI